MKNRYRIVRYRRYGGVYYVHDTEADLRWSLRTKDKARATELLVAKNEAAREPAFNLQKARLYMAASDPRVLTRTTHRTRRDSRGHRRSVPPSVAPAETTMRSFRLSRRPAAPTVLAFLLVLFRLHIEPSDGMMCK